MFLTPLFAAILGLLLVALSLNVVRYRMKHKISLGTSVKGESDSLPALERAVRAHANFCEYVPLALILLWFVETMTMSSTIPLLLGSGLVLGRVMHVIGMLYPRKWLLWRQIGVVLTLSTILLLSLYLVYWYLPIAL